jgi:hypothetical protein
MHGWLARWQNSFPEGVHGQRRNRFPGAGGQIQGREGFALSAFCPWRRARHRQRAIRGELCAVELKPWARKNGKGVFINHEASRTSNDCYVCEIAPGRKLAPQHHLFEEMILVLSGMA